MKNFQKILTGFGGTLVLALAPVHALAASGQLDNPLAFSTLTDFLNAVLELVIAVGFPFIVLFLVFIGFKFVAAASNPEELKKTRNLLFWALIGALIVLGAQVLAAVIGGTVEQLGAGVL